MSINPQRTSRIFEENIKHDESLREENHLLKLTLIAASVLIVAAIVFFYYYPQTDYEKGMNYLQEKKYEQAKAEFESVDPDDNNYTMAHSKINYIKGKISYENGDQTKALLFLKKVEPSDEYFEESKLIVEKIYLGNNIDRLETLKDNVDEIKDTVIIEKEVLREEKDLLNKSEAEPSSKNNSVKLPPVIIELYNDFENNFRAAENLPAEKIKNHLYMMDSMYISYTRTEIYKETDPYLRQVNNTAALWMQNRLAFLSKSVDIQNTVNPNNTRDKKASLAKNELTSLKKEGDSLYSKLQKLIK